MARLDLQRCGYIIMPSIVASPILRCRRTPSHRNFTGVPHAKTWGNQLVRTIFSPQASKKHQEPGSWSLLPVASVSLRLDSSSILSDLHCSFCSTPSSILLHSHQITIPIIYGLHRRVSNFKQPFPWLSICLHCISIHDCMVPYCKV